MIDRGRHGILGVRINAVDYETTVVRTLRAAQHGRPLAVSALAVHGLMTGVLDTAQRYRLNRFDLLVPDGQPVRWALNWLHAARLPDRVYGPHLMLAVCERAAAERIPVFLFGSSDRNLTKLQARLIAELPQLQIAGTRASKYRTLSADERCELINEIRSSGARITFVGLGCPRQEVFVYELCEALSMPLLAVGAAFDFHAGTLPQAPHWMQRRGLEWLFRLAAEPQRLWRRYLLLNPFYLVLILLQATGIYTIRPEQGHEPTLEISYG